MTKSLKGKRILFFANKLFGIQEQIIKELELQGAIVDYFDERPANSFFVKALIRINRNLIALYVNKYHRRIIESIKKIHYDYIFFIKGESFSRKILNVLFSLNPEAETIIYHWDSIANNRNALRLLSKFNRKFSFDRKDCLKFGMSFLPLFYFNEYKTVAQSNEKKKYDLAFIGTVHSDRYRFIKSIEEQILRNGGKCFIYFFFQSKLMYYKYKIMNKALWNIPMSSFRFVPLGKQEILEIYKHSRMIVDVQHPNQTGLTLRCIEALGAKRKLITSNKEISAYDFYRPSNIEVVDREKPVISEAFFISDYEEISQEIYEKYSISNWVRTIFLN